MISTFQRRVFGFTSTLVFVPALAFSQTAEIDTPFESIGKTSEGRPRRRGRR